MSDFPTPHIDARPGDFAKTVLMPGDPKRAKFIADSYLENAKLINDVRGVQGYTGYYNQTRVSVMASGMGMPAISIYAHELYNVFGVENIIRVGSMGGYADDIKLRDVVLAVAASTDSNMQSVYGINGHFAPSASYPLIKIAAENAKQMGITPRIGNVLSSDSFYAPNLSEAEKWRSLGILGVEMEAAALYMAASECKKNALAILTVSDHVFSGKAISADAREQSLNDMIVLALSVVNSMK